MSAAKGRKGSAWGSTRCQRISSSVRPCPVLRPRAPGVPAARSRTFGTPGRTRISAISTTASGATRATTSWRAIARTSRSWPRSGSPPTAPRFSGAGCSPPRARSTPRAQPGTTSCSAPHARPASSASSTSTTSTCPPSCSGAAAGSAVRSSRPTRITPSSPSANLVRRCATGSPSTSPLSSPSNVIRRVSGTPSCTTSVARARSSTTSRSPTRSGWPPSAAPRLRARCAPTPRSASSTPSPPPTRVRTPRPRTSRPCA